VRVTATCICEAGAGTCSVMRAGARRARVELDAGAAGADTKFFVRVTEY